ncbi:MAG: BamA/TamA family outer membrane protein [Candidatus Pseudobacter hemicellulosilyticus]|uniref:BamA/TamA family outer membrane protein n=1 Tax=Candidatus Pseudobacter hemicellulosilyticus TaxID=3121375 RepID=A0AAJ6BGE1_9BACT|nr:MAG: BamA/TamA family outer membrane protein [Pseudobacter sp.]
MQRFCFRLVLFILTGIGSVTAQDSVVHRILLVGDAGKLQNGQHPELNLLRKVVNLDDGRNTLLFLGDNVYQHGLPDSAAANFSEKKMILDSQIDIARGTNTQAWFIPGNHDWKKGHRDGLQQLQHQYRYIESQQLPNVHFLPADGCPGPIAIPVSKDIVLLIIDSQWWFQRENRPGADSDCDCQTGEELALAIKDLLYKYRDKLVVFAAHHPFQTYGEHGGYFTLKQHLFPLTEVNPGLYIPLPVIGSIYPLSRSWFGNIQDMANPVYKAYVQQIDTLLSHHPYCIRVGGHDHALQFILQQGQYHIVSGAGAKQSQVRYGPGTQFASPGTGFSILEMYSNGAVAVKFYSSLHTIPEQPIYQATLNRFSAPILQPAGQLAVALPDSVTAPGYQYYAAGKFKQWLLGSNYRKEWTTPLRVPVFDMGKAKGGLKPTQRGGGMQSRSLRLEDARGKEYVLRSIEKYPDKTLPEEFRQTFVKDAIVDGISASYPYAALSIPPLAQAAGVPHAHPQLVYLPDDPRLLQYRSDFGNGLYLFEERQPEELEKTYSSPKVFEKLQEDNDNKVDQDAVLQARLLDLFIMDFDRHEDQWRWGAAETKKGKTYYPIPRDRDQAFFTNSGLIPGIIRQPFIIPKFQGFRAKARNISTFNFNARYFDRSFLNDLNEKDWAKAVDAFLPLMTDSIIREAFAQQPAEVRGQSAPAMIQTLQERRKFLKEEAIEYYKFLAREVDVTGSDKRERFEITRNTDGSVQVVIHKINKEGEEGKRLYKRLFIHGETREIRLWGMGGEDKFVIQGDGRKTIPLRIIGGSGVDTFVNNAGHTGAGKTKIYDLRNEQNLFSGNGSWRNKLSASPAVNEYDRKAYKYNILAPVVAAAFNPDDGVFLGLGLKYTSHRFRRSPAAIHKLVVNHALATEAFSVRYSSDFRRVFGQTGIYVYANLNAPDYVTNFFGLGNETNYDKNKPGKINYYRARYNKGDIALLLRRELNSWLSVGIGPAFQFFKPEIEENEGRFLADTDANGLDPNTLFHAKTYLGGQLVLNIDTRDNAIMPSRGVYWQNSLRILGGMNDYSSKLTQLNSDLAMYYSFNSNGGLVLATRFGGGVNFGDYEFFQAQYLGNTENLRGYRKFRFAGRSSLFNNTELRIKVVDFKTYLLPGSLGIVAFHDIGRVWVKNDDSDEWHTGYGGGIWLGIVKRAVVTASVTASKENVLPLLTFGYQF